MRFMTRNGVSADGARSVVVSMSTDDPMPEKGAKLPPDDRTLDLIDPALCGA